MHKSEYYKTGPTTNTENAKQQTVHNNVYYKTAKITKQRIIFFNGSGYIRLQSAAL